MDPESKTYEEHTKKARRNLFLILVSLLIVTGILATVFLWVSCHYKQTDASLISKHEDTFLVLDGFLYPFTENGAEAGTYVASYDLSTGELQKYPVETLDLAPYGLEGSFRYFRYLPADSEEGAKGRIVPAQHTALPLSRANTEAAFVYTNDVGEKFWVNTITQTASPLFDPSLTETIDPYGKEIFAFSHGTRFALGVKNNALVIYTRKNVNDFLIEERKDIDFSEYGTLLFAESISESYVRVTCQSEDGALSFYICKPETGAVSPCAKNETTLYTPEASVYTPYGQLYLMQSESKEKEENDPYLFRYTDASLGTVFEHKLPSDTAFSSLAAVSPNGEYALIEHGTDEADTTFTFSKTGGKWLFFESGGRSFHAENLTEILSLKEDEELDFSSAQFLADNIVLINVLSPDGTHSAIFKICF